MLLDLEDLVRTYAWEVTGVVHCGAHLAEEAAEYDRLFPGVPVHWIEANPAVIPKIQKVLRPYPHQRVIQALLWSESDVEKTFHVTNYDGMSSSVYPFGTHPEFSPDTVYVRDVELVTSTLWDLHMRHDFTGANLLNMDLQGAEIPCLLGAGRLLGQIQYISSEVNTAEVYEGCSQLPDLDELLARECFKRIETYMVPGQGWGDAAWIRT